MSVSKKFKTNSNMNHLQTAADRLLLLEDQLSDKLDALQFGPPIEYIYNPLEYARDMHYSFIKKYLSSSNKKIMFLGMNPGPWGMSQTGIPFGDNKTVKEWFHMSGEVGHPPKEHPARKIEGLACQRIEVSGKRFWQLFKNLCLVPENFFKHSFVYNICPLAFLAASGRNVTPAELKAQELKTLNLICDETFIQIVHSLNVEFVIGIGKFAEKRANLALKGSKVSGVKVVSIPHPSPRNLKNSKNWPEVTKQILNDLNLLQYFLPS